MREDGQRTCSRIMELRNFGGVVVYDDFEGIVKFGDVGSYTGGVELRQTTDAYGGDACLQVSGRGAFPDYWQWYYSARSLGFGSHCAYFVEGVVKIPGAFGAVGVRVVFDLQEAATNPRCGIEWNAEEGKFYYWDSGAFWVEAASGSAGLAVDAWHRFAMGVDFERGIYLGARFDNVDFDIMGEGIPVWASGGPERFVLALGVASWKRQKLNARFDNILVVES